MPLLLLTLLLALALLAPGCGKSAAPPGADTQNAGALDPCSVEADPYPWKLPQGFPKPRIPADNPMSEPKVELGRHLFYDTRLSLNGTQSCASCHEQSKAFTDGRAQSQGSTGELHPRSSMSLVNVGYAGSLTWANPALLTLEDQALVPMFGTEPVELGLRGQEAVLLERLSAEPRYQALLPKSFPLDPAPLSVGNVTRALAAFQRTLVSGDAPFDRYSRGEDPSALTDSARRGRDLFNSEKLECFHCHNGFTMTNSVDDACRPAPELRFHNTGLYNTDGLGQYPAPNTGVHALSGKPEDMGRFRAPTLRNVALTAPYMHDGSIPTLSLVLDHYAAAGRTLFTGPNAGEGSKNPYKDGLLVGFTLTPGERADVLAFLESLTDPGLLSNPDYADPWPHPCQHCP